MLDRLAHPARGRAANVDPTDHAMPMAVSAASMQLRQTITDDICAATACSIPIEPGAEPPAGTLAAVMDLLLPLMVAGTHCIEMLSPAIVPSDGRRVVVVADPLHENPCNPLSTQLAYIVDRVDYIAGSVGFRPAIGVSKFLKGERRVCYDLGIS